MRLIVAVDRIVDPLRRLVSFINGASTFELYLLEVQQFRAPDGLRIASINIFGGSQRASASRSAVAAGGQWDEQKFLERLERDADANDRSLVVDLLTFIQQEADVTVWGKGTAEGTAHFGVRRNGQTFNLFYVSTNGRVCLSGALQPTRIPRESLQQLLGALKDWQVPGISDDLLANGAWVAFEASRLQSSNRLRDFKERILGFRESSLS